MHSTNALGPLTFKLLKIIEKLLGIIGNFEIPLRKSTLIRNGATPPALTINDLLICKNCLATRTPIDRRIVAINKTLFPHLKENPLAPLVVFRVTGIKHTIIVVGKAHATHSFNCLLYILMRPDASLSIVLNCGVFRGEAKGVKTHGVKHIKTAHASLSSHCIANGVVACMTHMQVSRRIREHLKHILLGFRGILIGLVELFFFPDFLPRCLDLLGIVRRNLKGIGMFSAVAHSATPLFVQTFNRVIV